MRDVKKTFSWDKKQVIPTFVSFSVGEEDTSKFYRRKSEDNPPLLDDFSNN